MRVVAVLAVRNEARFLRQALKNLGRQGVEAYVCDNGSTDGSVEIAESFRGRGLVGIEHVPFDGVYRWQALLRRKEELFESLHADWFMHADADEIHLPPRDHATIANALAEVDRQGCDTVEVEEFAFIPTREAPDHDHEDFESTLRTYYPFRPISPHCVRFLKKQRGPMEIAWSGGHRVRFAAEARLSPVPFRMRHYIFLGHAHAERKYVQRRYDDREVNVLGWHGWRPSLRAENIRLPAAAELRSANTDDDLDPVKPWTRHWLDLCLTP